MITFEQLQSKQEAICVVGLGYVGLPLAVLLSEHFHVLGFDIDTKKIAELEKGYDRTGEVTKERLEKSSLTYSADPQTIAQAKFIIIAVPTPVDSHNIPNLSIVKSATRLVAEHMQKGSIVVYESTVYPGVTEDMCLPIIEEVSGLSLHTEFGIAYSPERVNPGDKKHTIDKITKVISGSNEAVFVVLEEVYGSITNTFRAVSIKAAEAAKVIENTQRDVNIALMNELAMIFHKMDLSIYDVLEAANTKWNFLPFTPGLVGGHCIGVDPYYLTYKAQELGHTPEVMLSGRGINDAMHVFMANDILKKALQLGKDIASLQVAFYGMTFKENVPDIRNSKVVSLYKELCSFGMKPFVYDPYVDKDELMHEYGIPLVSDRDDIPVVDILIVAVAHRDFAIYCIDELMYLTKEHALIVDIKHLYNKEEIEKSGRSYWSL